MKHCHRSLMITRSGSIFRTDLFDFFCCWLVNQYLIIIDWTFTDISSLSIDNYSTRKSTEKGWIQSESVSTTSEWTRGKNSFNFLLLLSIIVGLKWPDWCWTLCFLALQVPCGHGVCQGHDCQTVKRGAASSTERAVQAWPQHWQVSLYLHTPHISHWWNIFLCIEIYREI